MADSEIHLLDVGRTQYGDCVLCRIKDKWILIDGGHRADYDDSPGYRSIPSQIRGVMGLDEQKDILIDLLVVSHAHSDHIGCLPELVQNQLTARYALLTDPELAWPPVARPASDRSSESTLFAMLREEPRIDLNADTFGKAAADAIGLSARYRAMIETMLRRNTEVYLHGSDDVAELEAQFRTIGLRVVGPSNDALAETADFLATTSRAFVSDIKPLIADGSSPFSLYQRIVQGWADAADPDGPIGPAVNMQSSVLVFNDGRHSFLFSGDSQMEKPEIPGPAVRQCVADMREQLRALAAVKPFDFVKIGHHGSYNALGPKFLSDLGNRTVNFGICTGSQSRHHPNPAVINALKEHSPGWQLGRTDRNGLVSFLFQAGQVQIMLERGQVNDESVPNSGSDTPSAAQAPRATVPPYQAALQLPPTHVVVPVVSESSGPVEIRVPYNPLLGLEISVQIKIAPAQAIAQAQPSLPSPGFLLANGRPLPKLLFLTSVQALARNVGQGAVDQALGAIQSAGHEVLDLEEAAFDEDHGALREVQRKLMSGPEFLGVVILGGYDVIPALKIDAAGPGGDQELKESDHDAFVVWSDNLYTDVDGDGLPELPVSRIPDGHSAELLLAALGAPASQGRLRHGIHNVQRPYAKDVFSSIPGVGSSYSSFPYSVSSNAVSNGDYFYFVLHGDHEDATRFWGETQQGDALEAIHIDHVKVGPGAVIFTGCCWGALPVVEPAYAHTDRVTPRTARDSMALHCLNQGALAYVGCTGVHYSPGEPPYDRMGKPIHVTFWDYVKAGHPPAVALHEAKKALGSSMKEHAGDEEFQAYDLKHIHQFCLLGLGW